VAATLLQKQTTGISMTTPCEEIHEELYSGMPAAVILNESNPLDPSTPVGQPMSVVGWGINGHCITYNVTGWDQIATERNTSDEYFIVESGETCHVIRLSINHTLLFAKKTVTELRNCIGGLVDDWEDDYEDEDEDEDDDDFEADDAGWY
jgi:hypothetical protein